MQDHSKGSWVLEKCSLPAEKNGKKSYSGKGGESLSGYILCQTKTADSPYFIENISTNIYTLEELCYYLFHNLYLIDDTVMNERLCLWLQDELNLPGLAARLRANLEISVWRMFFILFLRRSII